MTFGQNVWPAVGDGRSRSKGERSINMRKISNLIVGKKIVIIYKEGLQTKIKESNLKVLRSIDFGDRVNNLV